MLKILQARLQQYVNHEIPDVQAGFRRGRRTRSQIANICWIIKKAREFQKNFYFCFAAAKSLQSCPTLCDPIDGLLPGSFVPGILQARVLEWDAIAFSKERSNYCTIALISYASKVMLKNLQARLQQYVNHELPDVQAGFRKDRRTRDQIANIHWIIEKAREFQEKIYFCFIN